MELDELNNLRYTEQMQEDEMQYHSIDELGEDGWELVTLFHAGQQMFLAVFKKVFDSSTKDDPFALDTDLLGE